MLDCPRPRAPKAAPRAGGPRRVLRRDGAVSLGTVCIILTAGISQSLGFSTPAENGKTKLVMPALAQGSGGIVREGSRDSGGSANADGKGTGAGGGTGTAAAAAMAVKMIR